MNSAMFLAAQRATRRSGKKMCRGKQQNGILKSRLTIKIFFRKNKLSKKLPL
jgi:hypothetical protein